MILKLPSRAGPKGRIYPRYMPHRLFASNSSQTGVGYAVGADQGQMMVNSLQFETAPRRLMMS